ncbi:hypothetical protein [Kitasatospora azatica]|uniref:hypothetical protein n=1 Tax=Kitasatospora azatica TaxID=58347 RepID=UPI0012F78DC5|nr:hypothetical protein [Kitasatospora azatica]
MRGFMRKLAVGAALAVVGGGLTFASAGPAAAGGWGCSGSEVSGSPYAVTSSSGSTVYSNVHLYYDSATGNNCAVNVKAGSLYGISSYVDVTLEECAQDSGSSCTTVAISADPGGASPLYKYYAGPVSVPGRGHCIRLFAETDNANSTDDGTIYLGPFHC